MMYPEFENLPDMSNLLRLLCIPRLVRILPWCDKATQKSRMLPAANSTFNITSELPLYIISARPGYPKLLQTARSLALGVEFEPKPHRALVYQSFVGVHFVCWPPYAYYRWHCPWCIRRFQNLASRCRFRAKAASSHGVLKVQHVASRILPNVAAIVPDVQGCPNLFQIGLIPLCWSRLSCQK